ncbi:MAG: hypothetical protein H6600_04660 [Flavobacteriales bacterium]|nr:hypothetical protein [Flavobacteriales bacterium]MCB9196740.1 hypothetical protein [Flavobacteriales bacterium]MCB9197727.1 hypothetical protein [Flavobacteriales bacterium]
MIRSILYIFLLLIPFVALSTEKDSLKDSKIHFSGHAAAYSLIQTNERSFINSNQPYVVQEDWRNHFNLISGVTLEWKKLVFSYSNGIITGTLQRNFIFENKDQALSLGNDIWDYQVNHTILNASTLTFVLNFGRRFNLPRTRLNIIPFIGVRANYTFSRSKEFAYSGFAGDHVYDIQIVEVELNPNRRMNYVPTMGIDIFHSFRFGEVGLSMHLSSVYFNYDSYFYTSRAYAFSDDSGWVLNAKNFLGLGLKYKFYFN